MKAKEVTSKIILNSRGEETVEILTKTAFGTFSASAPSGKSVGKYETPAFVPNIKVSLRNLKDASEKILAVEMDNFLDLDEIEKIIPKEKFGANVLFALESSLLKALAAEQGKNLWQVINPKAKSFPYPVGNCIGGGKHTAGKLKPEFQEFLVIPMNEKFIDRIFTMRRFHELCGKRLELLGAKGKPNDENAWSTTLGNDKTLDVMEETRDELVNEIGRDVLIGVDVASSSFFENGKYNYINPPEELDTQEQINYLARLIEKYELGYVEDPLQEEDFNGFWKLKEEARKIDSCLIVGDDLTVSKLERLKEAVKRQSISALIVKPNQNGSLLEIGKVMEFAKSRNIKTVFSHRSGETMDYALADLAFGFQADYIKTGVAGKEREVKLQRLVNIEKEIEK
jgi:enolase